jgi:hypothetical protein
MNIDYRRSLLLNEEERSLVRALLRARAVGVVVVVAGIAVIGFSGAVHREVAVVAAPDDAVQDVAPADPGLAALERGVVG